MVKRLLMMPLVAVGLGASAEVLDSVRHEVLQEVSVVATIKENGTMRQQPASVTMLDKAQLEANRVTSLKGTSAIVPNLFIPDYGSRLTSAMYIRGIGSRINTPAVGLYVDNIPYVDKSAFDFNFYDIERVDVLRGPQATLYGRNTMGGLMRIYTKSPLFYEGTDVHLGYASGDNRRTASLTHYHRFNDQFALSAGGYYEGSDGFFKNDLTGKKSDAMQAGGGKLRAVYQPNGRLSFDLTAGYDYSDENAYPYYYTGTLSAKNPSAGGMPEPYPASIGKIMNNRESSYRRGLLNVGLNTQYLGEGWQLNAVTAYQNINDRMYMDQDFLAPDIYTLEQRQRINTFTEEVTLKSTGKRTWEWLTGVNFMHQTLHTVAPVTFYSDGLQWLEGNINSLMPSIDNIPMLQKMGFESMKVNFRGDQMRMSGTYETPTTDIALFHQSTIHMNDHLSATVGLRLEYEHQQMDCFAPADVDYGFKMANSKSPFMNVDLQDLRAEIRDYDGKLNNDRWMALPKVALKYDFDNHNNIFASFAMGQRSGGYNLQMFNEVMQGALRVDMMDGVKAGVGGYLDMLSATSGMPASVVGSVKGMLEEKMPKFETPSMRQVVYKPEYSWNVELGSHLTLADHALMLDAAVFYHRIYDQQIARFAPSGLGRMMVNAGESQSCGGELSARWTPDTHFALTANYGFTHAEFVKYDDGQGNDYAGKRVPFVPRHNMNVDAAYTWHLKAKDGAGWWAVRNITVGANMVGAGRIYWTENNSVSQPFYCTLGARVGVETSRLSLSLWGRNITDKSYNTFYFESAGRGFEQHCRPAQVGVDLNVKL